MRLFAWEDFPFGLLSNTTQVIPTRVKSIPKILPVLRVSPNNIQARSVVNAGDKLRNKRPNLGPNIMYARKRNKSPIAKPTIPELPNQNHWAGRLLTGMGVPKMIQWVNPNNIMATISLSRLVISGPNFLPAIVKKTDDAEKQIAVINAAISPILDVMGAHELFSCSMTGLVNTFSA